MSLIKDILAKSYIGECLIIISHSVKDYIYTRLWYNNKKISYNKTAVAVVDGKLYSGGLTDRFIGIVSLYAWCKENGINFRVSYTSPFSLSDYVQPNKYDWTIRNGDYVCSSKCARLIYAVGEKHFARRLNLLYKLNKKKQIHFYGNRDILLELQYKKYNWGTLFQELFKPSQSLQDKLTILKKQIGNEYFSITLRFQNLLGDFDEYDFKSIESEIEKDSLVKRCKGTIINLIQQNSNKHCLVTSDSIHFLNEVSSIDGVYVIPGTLVHMGSNAEGSYEQYEKSFLDFFMLADSSRIYNIVYGDMYPSGFPQFAAKIHDVEFLRIK